MISTITTRREGHLEQPISTDAFSKVARGLVDREALLQTLDRAVTRRITIISAPAGSGKTSLLHAWAQKDRLTDLRRLAFVSVERDEQDAQRFWSAVWDALRGLAASAESHVQSTPPARRRRLAVAIASLRLALARRSGQFTEVMEQVHLLEASTDESSDQILMEVRPTRRFPAQVAVGRTSFDRLRPETGQAAHTADGGDSAAFLGSELRGVALMNLGIVETWSGRFDDAERHLSEGAVLAQAIGRPYLEVACRAHQGFPSTSVSLATARERGRQAVALAERYGLQERPILAPALGWLGCFAVWTGEFNEAERWLRRAWEVATPQIDPAAAVLLHASTGMLHAARGQHQSALQEFAAALRAQSLLSGALVLGPPIAGWFAATQARLGMLDDARATLTGFSAEDELVHGIRTARAAICIAEGDPSRALDLLQDVLDAPPPAGLPVYGLVEAHLHAGIAHLDLGDRSAAAAAAEAALAAAEPDRLIFPFAMIGTGELLDALPRHKTAHGALLGDIADVLRVHRHWAPRGKSCRQRRS